MYELSDELSDEDFKEVLETNMFNNKRVFVKIMPITEKEIIAFDGKDMYNLDPMFLFVLHKNSPNPWREVIAQREAYVKNPRIFPQLYYVRVVDLKTNHDFDYTIDSELNVKIKELNESTKYLAIISEYLGGYIVMDDYLKLYPSQIEEMIKKMIYITDIMRDIQLYHFDAHLFNFMTDGFNVKVIDFGTSILIPYTTLRVDEKLALSNVTYRDFGMLIFNIMICIIYININDINRDHCYYIMKNMRKYKFMNDFLKYQQICLLLFDYFDDDITFPNEKIKIELEKCKQDVFCFRCRQFGHSPNKCYRMVLMDF